MDRIEWISQFSSRAFRYNKDNLQCNTIYVKNGHHVKAVVFIKSIRINTQHEEHI